MVHLMQFCSILIVMIERSHSRDENTPSLTCKGGSFEPLEPPSYAPELYLYPVYYREIKNNHLVQLHIPV